MFEIPTVEEQREKDRQRAADWDIAYARLCIDFEADHDGGWPRCLNVKGMGSAERLALLKRLGYRVRRTWDNNIAMPGEPEDLERWAAFSGKLAVSLDDGFVCRGR